MIDAGYWLFATATLVTHIFIAALVVLFFLNRSGKKNRTPTHASWPTTAFTFFQKNRFNFIFAATFIATLGSLFFSEIAKFAPCILCWYQRIFTYPQALISYIAIMRDEGKILTPYLLAMNVAGILFSAYHNFILWFPQYGALVTCSSKGGPSCIEGYTFYYGYITIPMMALTVFVFSIVMLTLYRDLPEQKKKLMN